MLYCLRDASQLLLYFIVYHYCDRLIKDVFCGVCEVFIIERYLLLVLFERFVLLAHLLIHEP